jgi:DNA-binding Lrp family transcriptional regulator
VNELDETDMEILRLLDEDARRPFSEIADAVDLSGPAVSDRVTKLADAGVIEGFTLEVDHSQLRAGIPVFVRVTGIDGDVESLADHVGDEPAVEHLFVTADRALWFHARAQGERVRAWLDELLADADGVEYSVTLLDEVRWEPTLSGAEFALTCVECGNTVDSEGESTRIDGDVYHFCCPSCHSRFTDRYDRLEADA